MNEILLHVFLKNYNWYYITCEWRPFRIITTRLKRNNFTSYEWSWLGGEGGDTTVINYVLYFPYWVDVLRWRRTRRRRRSSVSPAQGNKLDPVCKAGRWSIEVSKPIMLLVWVVMPEGVMCRGRGQSGFLLHPHPLYPKELVGIIKKLLNPPRKATKCTPVSLVMLWDFCAYV